MEAGMGKVTWKINTLTHADDTTLLLENKDDMIELIKWVKNSSERVGLNLNLKKTTVMSTVEKVHIFSGGEDNSTVNKQQVFGGSPHQGQRHQWREQEKMSLSKAAMANLTKTIKDLEVSTNPKVKLL